MLLYRARNKGMQILLSNSQAVPGTTVKQEQEEISRNHVQAFIPGSVVLGWRSHALFLSFGNEMKVSCDWQIEIRSRYRKPGSDACNGQARCGWTLVLMYLSLFDVCSNYKIKVLRLIVWLPFWRGWQASLCFNIFKIFELPPRHSSNKKSRAHLWCRISYFS